MNIFLSIVTLNLEWALMLSLNVCWMEYLTDLYSIVVSFKDVEASHSEKTGRDDDDDDDMDEDAPTKVVKPETPDSMFIFKSKNP